MTDMPYGGTLYDGDASALVPEFQPPADDIGLGTGYDGDPGAFAAEDQLPARQDARTATWDDDDPGYDEAGLSGEYDGELEALTSGDQLPSRQESRAATWGDDPDYVSEADLGSGYDGDLDALTAGDYAMDHARGDQGQAAEPHEPTSAGSPADADAAEAGAGEPQDQLADAVTRQATQADDGRARPETALEAELKDLKAENQAGIAELKAELQSLRDRLEAIPDGPGNTGRDAGQPRLNDRELPVDRQSTREAEHQVDRPGIWSNAKTQWYGGIGATATGVVLAEYFPNVPAPVVIAGTGLLTIASQLVPVLREGWRKGHGNPPDKP